MLEPLSFTKKEVDEINDAIDDSLKYYQDLLDEPPPSDPEGKKMSIEHAQARIKIIESIKRKLEH